MDGQATFSIIYNNYETEYYKQRFISVPCFHKRKYNSTTFFSILIVRV